jgi:DNA (cytosine-5)-methyltransferase 3A
MNVLSLFDGMSCGRIALERAGIPVTNYYASEIDKYAIQVAKKNYPDTHHIGDVTQVSADDLPEIDLLMGGSPCQGFSFAGKQLNFDDPRSALFFEFVRLLNETKPKYFLLENVRMKKEYQDVISEQLGVQPVKINSSLVSAQNRVRLYWTNIPNITQPEDKGIVLKHILETDYIGDDVKDTARNRRNCRQDDQKAFTCTATMYKGAGANGMTLVKNSDRCIQDGWTVDRDKSHCLDANYIKGGNLKSYFEKHRRQLVFSNDGLCHIGDADLKGNDSIKRIYHPAGKSPTLTTMQGGHREPKIICGAFRGRYEPDGTTKQRLELRPDYKTNTLTRVQKDNVAVDIDKLKWRKLTPLECERLQTVPDNYTDGVSNTQRYKMLGNGWTVDVIAHIFKGIK